MIDRIKEFFSQFIEPGLHGGDAAAPALQVATAALLLEMMRMDDTITGAEMEAIRTTLQGHFALDGHQLKTLLELAAAQSREASGYHPFTSLINRHADYAQKVRIIEHLWHVAMIDGHLDAHELHLMRKLADLLHVGQADYLAAKQRARQSANLPA